jgi:tetratricopeptide (TPR) repeat protein
MTNLLERRAAGGIDMSVKRLRKPSGFAHKVLLTARRLRACAAGGAVVALVCTSFAQGAFAQNTNQSPPAQSTAPKAASPAPANDNAFPEAESEAAQKSANAAEKSASNGPAATSPGAAPDSSSRSGMQGIDLLGENDSRISNGAGGVVEDPKLAKEDLRVGQLYMGEGNYAGAYSRFKEATLVGPGNAEAVFYLAEAARKSAHLDEAAKNYQLYLEADPKGKKAKDSKKALEELSGK